MSPEMKDILEALIYIIGGVLLFVIRQRSQREIDATKEKVNADLSAHKQAVVAQAQAQTATLESRLAETFTQQLQDTERALSAKVEELSLENTELNRRLDTVTRELAHERGENRDLRTLLESKQAEREQLRKEVDGLAAAIDAIKRERDIAADALKLSNESERALQFRVEALERELRDLQLRYAETQAELRAYKLIVEPFMAQLALAFKPTPMSIEPIPPLADVA